MPQDNERFEEPSGPMGRRSREDAGPDRGAYEARPQGGGAPEDRGSERYGYRTYGIPYDYNYQGPGRERWDEDLGPRGPGPGPGRRSFREEPRDRDAYPDRGASGRGESPEGRNFWSRARDEVSAWLGDDAAARRRRDDDFGHSGRGPRSYQRSDARIREDVCDALGEDPILDATELEVQVSEGEVTLTGKIFRRADKARAEDIAESVRGVRHVQNNLRFEDPLAGAGGT